MAKPQRSKRARKARKAAQWASLRGNTGHPSHMPQGDLAAQARILEKRHHYKEIRRSQ